jgi:hypothetical protein
MVECGKMFAAFFCAEKINYLFLQTESGTRIPEGATRYGIHTFSRLSCRFNVSIKCPEFEIARKRAAYISPRLPH